MTTLPTLGITGKLDDGHADSFDGAFVVFRSSSCCIYKFHRKQLILRHLRCTGIFNRMIKSLQVVDLMIFLFLVLVVQCESSTEIGDYIVDCSACNSVPAQGVKAYIRKVRCEAEGMDYYWKNLLVYFKYLSRLRHTGL